MKMLESKRFQVAITSELVGLDMGSEILAQHFVVSEMPLYIAFSKAKGNQAAKWAEEVSDQLAALKKDGTIDKIIQSYTH